MNGNSQERIEARRNEFLSAIKREEEEIKKETTFLHDVEAVVQFFYRDYRTVVGDPEKETAFAERFIAKARKVGIEDITTPEKAGFEKWYLYYRDVVIADKFPCKMRQMMRNTIRRKRKVLACKRKQARSLKKMLH